MLFTDDFSTDDGLVSVNGHYTPHSAAGEKCKCGESATHKVEEVSDLLNRHPFTMYLCCKCFGELMGLLAQKICKEK